MVTVSRILWQRRANAARVLGRGNSKELYVTLTSCARTGYRGRDRNTIRKSRYQVGMFRGGDGIREEGEVDATTP